MSKNLNPLTRLWRYLFTSRLQEIPFIVFLSFLLTFLITRFYLYIVNRDILELPGAIYLNGVHIHHLNIGIIILALTGFWSIYDLRPTLHRLLAIIYGIGLGLTFDEFALWFMLKDNYYARLSYDAVITVALILLNVIYFPGFWSRMGKRLGRLLHLPHKYFLRKFPRPGGD
jgi:hypothetical protein